jgi:hypothetical protein
MLWSALRQFGERALANGTLTVTDIRTGLASACTLPQYTERLSPLPDNRRGGNAPPDAPLRFFVDLERDRIAWLVRLRLIKPNEAHDLVVILTALQRIGLTPSISCSA